MQSRRTVVGANVDHARLSIVDELLAPGVAGRVVGEENHPMGGAESVARRLSRLLDAPLVLQRYSRLVQDCNRPPEAPSAPEPPALSEPTAAPPAGPITNWKFILASFAWR